MVERGVRARLGVAGKERGWKLVGGGRQAREQYALKIVARHQQRRLVPLCGHGLRE
jgi:hypothetical protein